MTIICIRNIVVYYMPETLSSGSLLVLGIIYNGRITENDKNKWWSFKAEWWLEIKR